MRTLSAPISRWLTLCVMAWAAVWCCCAEPVMATPGVHERQCCDEERAKPVKSDHCPAELPDCPLVKVREQSVVATVTMPSFEPELAWLPTYLSLPVCRAEASRLFERNESADPPIPPRTLVALHTSLLW